MGDFYAEGEEKPVGKRLPALGLWKDWALPAGPASADAE